MQYERDIPSTMSDLDSTTLGQHLAFLRKREEYRRHEIGALPSNRKFSRERAAGEAHITASYLTKVERDEVGQVDVGILRLLASTYCASEDEWRYLCDLAGYAAPYPALAGMGDTVDLPPLEVFQRAVTPIMLTEMSEAVTDLVSFYAPPRRLITANRAYFDAFPTHRSGMYMLEWSFTDDAQEIMINWGDQVLQGVAWHRGLMGRYGRTAWARESHRRLWQFPEFRRLWEARAVSYERPIASQAQLRIRGNDYTMVMENWHMQHDLPITRSRGTLRPLT
ncbi:helix-turn-helix domain-containing protein [Nocardia sp. CA-107356]|uniref:helix-turn-helix domain-containing protein n=1 Tax=Nocardia sp. CA-107356 TaxID=3239972 RepID=UPI003D94DAE3